MDSQKALFRAKLKNAQKKDKRINSPLVRYNEADQLVCRVCDIVLKSDSLWDAHQVSRKHRQAISNLKAAAAAGLTEPRKEFSESKPEHVEEIQKSGPERSRESPTPQLSSSGLPPDFFDNSDTEKSNSKRSAVQVMETQKYKMPTVSSAQPARELTQTSKITGSEAKQAKGALPEGFFDNKEADLLARGIKPVKPDVKDEYKEFEKLIQEDLQEVENRLEEEEYDAAEMIEEAESVEQKTLREKVELLRKRKAELKAARSAKQSKSSKEGVKERPSREESSSDDDSDENFAVDWRAQHL